MLSLNPEQLSQQRLALLLALLPLPLLHYVRLLELPLNLEPLSLLLSELWLVRQSLQLLRYARLLALLLNLARLYPLPLGLSLIPLLLPLRHF